MPLFPNLFNKLVAYVLTFILAIGALPITATKAVAAALCSDAYSADSGQDTACGARRIGGQVVAYPKLSWTPVSEMPLVTRAANASITGGSEAVNLANRSANALNLTAKDIASAVALFPSNVPYVFARYNPLDSTLRVDIFKLEKTIKNGQQSAGLYQAVFAPAHGDFWKAGRAYITPESYKAGMTPGLNPFEAFKGTNTDLFYNISLTGAQVAVGHAMRYAGAPVAVLAVADTRISQETHKSGGVFRKKVTTITSGHASEKWLIAQPRQFMSRSTTYAPAAYCATDPSATSCPRYELASSGVSFEEFTGGMLSSVEDTWELDRQTKSGFSFIAVLIVAVIASFAFAAVAAAAMGGSAATAAGSVAVGNFGEMLIANGLVEGFNSLAASIAVESAFQAASMAIFDGANLSSMMKMSPSIAYGTTQVDKGSAPAQALPELQRRLNVQLAPKNTEDFSHGSPVLTSFSQTVYGDCKPDTPLAQCAGATGFIQHADQYDEHNMVNFMRDNNGRVMRDAAAAEASTLD